MEPTTHHALGTLFGGLALLIVAARLGGTAAARVKVPEVVGELLAGLLLGNLGLAILARAFADPTLVACAELGVLILMFEVGLESNLKELGRVGGAATAVAVTGVVVPLSLGIAVSMALGAADSIYGHLFVGAALSATSVGITARVLRDLGLSRSVEAQVILAAAVLDDVLGLLLLALVAALVKAADSAADVSIGQLAWLVGKAMMFLVIGLLAGQYLARPLFRGAALLSGKGTLVTTALAICFAYGAAAEWFGLAPAIGAFVAGLVIRPADYAPLTARGEGVIQEPLAPLAAVFVPIFFVLAGARVDLSVFGDRSAVLLAAVLTVAAIAGKLVAGFVAFGQKANPWIVGVGMVPRGEVGLIFASVGAALQLHGRPVVSPTVFSAVIVMVVVTSLLPPPLLARLARRTKAEEEG